ncbi:unnamed protein product [Urochloa humidicola]
MWERHICMLARHLPPMATFKISLQVRKKVLLLKKLIKNLLMCLRSMRMMCLRSTRMLWTLNLKAIISAWQKSNRSRKMLSTK